MDKKTLASAREQAKDFEAKLQKDAEERAEDIVRKAREQMELWRQNMIDDAKKEFANELRRNGVIKDQIEYIESKFYSHNTMRPPTEIQYVGLTGPKGVGKTSLANLAKLYHGYTILSFAGILKDMLGLMGVPECYIRGDRKDQVVPGLNVTSRYMQQTLGTDWGRNTIHEDVWVFAMGQKVDILMSKFAASRHAGDKIFPSMIFDDVRYDNEAIFIKAKGGTIIELGRPDVQRDNTHESEYGVSSEFIDFKITSTDVEEARQKLSTILERLEITA